MSYDIEDMLLLLLSIKHTSSSLFVMQHLSYGTVGELCEEALKEGLIIENRKTLQLTERGNIFIAQTNGKFNRKGIECKIAHIPDVIVDKIKLEDIYLPEKI